MSRLGIDIGGTKVALRAEQGDQTAESAFRWPATGDAGQDLALLGAEVRAFLTRWRAAPAAVGVAVPATCDATGSVTTWPGRPSWAGVNLTTALRDLFPATPVAHADDGDLAAVAEARAAGCSDLLYLGVGTGVGGGVVVAGRPWPGPARGSCEVGHLVIDRDGPRCDCGRRGCVQATASGPATLRRAAGLSGEEVTYPEFVRATTTAEPWAMAVLQETADALATAAVGISELAHPEMVVLGGGFAEGLPRLVPLVAESVRRLTRPGVAEVPVRPAMLGGLSSLRGALLLAEMTVPTPQAGRPARQMVNGGSG